MSLGRSNAFILSALLPKLSQKWSDFLVARDRTDGSK